MFQYLGLQRHLHVVLSIKTFNSLRKHTNMSNYFSLLDLFYNSSLDLLQKPQYFQILLKALDFFESISAMTNIPWPCTCMTFKCPCRYMTYITMYEHNHEHAWPAWPRRCMKYMIMYVHVHLHAWQDQVRYWHSVKNMNSNMWIYI